MGARGEAWGEAAEYARAVAGVGEQAARDRGVPAERLTDMRAALQLLRRADEDAFYVVVNQDYAAPAAGAVAHLLGLRAESEQEADARAAAVAGPSIGEDDPTPVTP